MDQKQIILDFLKKHILAVLSTTTKDHNPQSAVLEFGETPKLEIIFDTLRTSRKYKNLQTNKNVSLVIGWDENITIQYEGVAQELTGNELTKYRDLYLIKNPKAKKWALDPNIAYFKISPKWIRHSNLNQHPWEIFEINF
jgi:general stress protein 26